MQPLKICICPSIRIGREIWCLPYAGFLLSITSVELFSVPPAGVPNEGLLKSTMQKMLFTKNNFQGVVLPVSC